MPPSPNRRSSSRDPVSELFDAFSHPLRRHVLTSLVDEARWDVDALSAAGTEGEGLEIQLYHTHLPKLDEAGFVDWDPERGTVERGPRFETADDLMTVLSENPGALPAEWPPTRRLGEP